MQFHLSFTTYCSSPYKIHTVSCSMGTIWAFGGFHSKTKKLRQDPRSSSTKSTALTLKCAFQIFMLSRLCLYLCVLSSPGQRIVGQNSQKSVVVERPGMSGLLHYTYFILGHSVSFTGILNSVAVWVLERRACMCFNFLRLETHVSV